MTSNGTLSIFENLFDAGRCIRLMGKRVEIVQVAQNFVQHQKLSERDVTHSFKFADSAVGNTGLSGQRIDREFAMFAHRLQVLFEVVLNIVSRSYLVARRKRWPAQRLAKAEADSMEESVYRDYLIYFNNLVNI